MSSVSLNKEPRKLQSGQRVEYWVIVPPLTHKSAVLHERVKPLWAFAESLLAEANELTAIIAASRKTAKGNK